MCCPGIVAKHTGCPNSRFCGESGNRRNPWQDQRKQCSNIPTPVNYDSTPAGEQKQLFQVLERASRDNFAFMQDGNLISKQLSFL